jgi:hypothetical protein
MTKKVSKIVLYFFLSLVLLFILAAGYTQTPAFRANLRSALYETVKDNLNASVYIGEITGSIVTGLSIDTLMIYVDNAPLLETGAVSVRYDLFDLLRNRVTIDSLTIRNPTISLSRSTGGIWNVNRLSAADTLSDSTPSAWSVNATKIRLENATFRLVDSTGDFSSSVYIDGRKSINYSNIYLTAVELVVSGEYSTEKIAAEILNFAFISPREQFQLTGLSLDAVKTRDTVSISNLTLTTPDSKLACNAQISGLDLFSIGDLIEFENASTLLTVSRSSIAMNDLHTFLPELYFLKGRVDLDGDFAGTFAQLNVRQLNASFAQTDLHLSGTVSNIHQPEELRLNIVSKQSTINPTDVPALMPYFNIPQFEQLGAMRVDFQFVGKPLDFVVVSTVVSSAGTITVDGQLMITEENLHYKGLLAGTDVNLEKIFATSELSSRLNTRAYIEGSGTSIAQLNSELRVELDSSEFRGIDVSSATIEMKAHDRTIDTDLSIDTRDGSIRAATIIDFRRTEPAYMVSAQIRDLNLAPVMGDDYYVSRLSFDVNRSARSLDILDGISNTSITILPSSFREHFIDSASVSVRVALDSLDNRSIQVQSPVADAELKGQFTFTGFLGALNKGVDHILRLYAYQRQVVDSSFSFVESDAKDSSPMDTVPQSIGYSLTIKNLQPISHFFKLPLFDVQGTLNGTLSETASQTSFAGDLQLQRGIFIQDSTVIQARQTSVRYHLMDIDPPIRDHPLPLFVDLALDGFEIGINTTVLRYPKAGIRYDGDSGSFSLYSDIDTTMSIGVEGDVVITAAEEQLTFSLLKFIFQGFDAVNKRPFTATLSRTGIRVDSALFTHRDQTMMVNGAFSFNGSIDVASSIENFRMSDLYYFSTSREFRTSAQNFGGIINAEAFVTGTVSNPGFTVAVYGKDFSYDNAAIGMLNGSIRYHNRSADVAIDVRSDSATTTVPDVTLNGVIPIDLRFIHVEKRTDLPGMNVDISSTNLRMAALDPFIPELKELTGSIRSDIIVTGSLMHPVINGNAVLENGAFVLEMTGIPYLANGTVLFNEQTVTFSDFRISNESDDMASSRMDIGGHILLNGFAPDEYHLRARGELLVLRERSRTVGSSFFGSMIASTGNDSLRFDGNFFRSRITGVVLVRQASLTFPPTQQASTYSSSFFNVVEFIDDTSRPDIDSLLVESLIEMARQITAPNRNNKRTFLDGFGYELTIQTSGSVRVNMIFNANAGAYEELYAELNGKLTMIKDEGGVQLNGTINVGNESKYTFYKTFNARGSLTFVGDPQNPQLNILATYEGTHCVATNQTTTDCIREERVIVTLKIGGTRNVPEIKLGLKTIDQSGKEIERTGEVENDAISFLLTSAPGTPGKFRDELTAQDRDRIGEQLASTIGGTYINSLLSSYVMDFLQRNSIPFVKKFEVRQVGADPDIRIGAEVLDAYVNVGGKVFTNVNNANISVEIPLGDKQRRNFMLEVEKKTENFDYTIQARTILGARIFYRFTF